MANGRVIRIAAVGVTSTGEALANSSSFDLKWELNNCDQAAYWDESKGSPSDWERFLILQNESGLVYRSWQSLFTIGSFQHLSLFFVSFHISNKVLV